MNLLKQLGTKIRGLGQPQKQEHATKKLPETLAERQAALTKEFTNYNLPDEVAERLLKICIVTLDNGEIGMLRPDLVIRLFNDVNRDLEKFEREINRITAVVLRSDFRLRFQIPLDDQIDFWAQVPIYMKSHSLNYAMDWQSFMSLFDAIKESQEFQSWYWSHTLSQDQELSDDHYIYVSAFEYILENHDVLFSYLFKLRMKLRELGEQ